MKKSATARLISCNPAGRVLQKTETQILDDFDDLVLRGCAGDARAGRAIAVAVGPSRLREALDELGFDFAYDAGDVLQDFFAGMLEGRRRFIPAHGRARSWRWRILDHAMTSARPSGLPALCALLAAPGAVWSHRWT